MLDDLMHRGVQWGKIFHFIINNPTLEAEIMRTFANKTNFMKVF